MWDILLIRRRIAVEGLREGRNALKLRDGGIGLRGKAMGLWMDVYDN